MSKMYSSFEAQKYSWESRRTHIYTGLCRCSEKTFRGPKLSPSADVKPEVKTKVELSTAWLSVRGVPPNSHRVLQQRLETDCFQGNLCLVVSWPYTCCKEYRLCRISFKKSLNNDRNPWGARQEFDFQCYHIKMFSFQQKIVRWKQSIAHI